MDNPYKTMGVDEKASQEEIKKAFRKESKKHHPDKGGDSEKFSQLAKAYDILRDPKTRKDFDEGKYEENRKDPEKVAINNLCNMFISIVQKMTERQLTTFNIIARMKEKCNEGLREADKEIAQCRKAIKNIGVISDRLEEKEDHPPFLKFTLDAEKDSQEDRIKRMGKEKEIVELMIEILSSKSYKVDIAEGFYPSTNPHSIIINW